MSRDFVDFSVLAVKLLDSLVARSIEIAKTEKHSVCLHTSVSGVAFLMLRRMNS